MAPPPQLNTAVSLPAPIPHAGSLSPQQAAVPPKNVAFELLFPDSPQCRARLPMRVSIFPHDTTESIVTTVKNFYGLYSSPTGSRGVSFEDEHGNTLIARYENFCNGMTVYVRVIQESPVPSDSLDPLSQQTHIVDQSLTTVNDFPVVKEERCDQDAPFSTNPLHNGRCTSPDVLNGRRSPSVNGKKSRSRSVKSRGHSQADGYSESLNGYSSGDNAPSSTSGRNKDQLGNTDISVENIVEGGRRKRAKFESSELPLFAPPQMPAATSNPSVSPARRIDHHRPYFPMGSSHNPFTQPMPLQSPQPYYNGARPSTSAIIGADSRHTRASAGFASSGARATNASSVLPTPDPTVGSCMSEEDKDVAIQLMRLGDMSNISHGRTSASTLDDTFSGRADAASSTGATSECESESDGELPPARRQKLAASETVRQTEVHTDAHFMPPPGRTDHNSEEPGFHGPNAFKQSAPSKMHFQPSFVKPMTSKIPKVAKPSQASKVKKNSINDGATSPGSASASRKLSPSSNGNLEKTGEDDHPDLSTKPRCQRCRKSKKGCDRQRPCGRCRDAGLSADQCVSEDEGNGRKGRYGRHMGVPLKKDLAAVAAQTMLLPAAPIVMNSVMDDKLKKRKR